MSSVREATAQALGIIENENGERVIPATQRKDGSWRPERKIRQGFAPVVGIGPYVPPHLRVRDYYVKITKFHACLLHRPNNQHRNLEKSVVKTTKLVPRQL